MVSVYRFKNKSHRAAPFNTKTLVWPEDFGLNKGTKYTFKPVQLRTDHRFTAVSANNNEHCRQMAQFNKPQPAQPTVFKGLQEKHGGCSWRPRKSLQRKEKILVLAVNITFSQTSKRCQEAASDRFTLDLQTTSNQPPHRKTQAFFLYHSSNSE